MTRIEFEFESHCSPAAVSVQDCTETNKNGVEIFLLVHSCFLFVSLFVHSCFLFVFFTKFNLG